MPAPGFQVESLILWQLKQGMWKMSNGPPAPFAW